MDALEEEKLKEEIANLIAERKNIKSRFVFDIAKIILAFSGAIFLFFIIQNPESILRKQSFQSQIALDRFRLAQEALLEPDSSRRELLFRIIQSVYADDAIWREFIDTQLNQEKYLDAVAILSDNVYLKKLIYEKRKLLKQLQDEFNNEINGKGPSGIPGFGPNASKIGFRIKALEFEINTILEDIASKD